MFRTSKCSSSGRLVHAVLWHFFYVSSVVRYCTQLVNAVSTSCMMHCSYTQGVKTRFSLTATQLVKAFPVCHIEQI